MDSDSDLGSLDSDSNPLDSDLDSDYVDWTTSLFWSTVTPRVLCDSLRPSYYNIGKYDAYSLYTQYGGFDLDLDL